MDEKKKEASKRKNDAKQDKSFEKTEMEGIAAYVRKAVSEAKAEWEKNLGERIAAEREDAAKQATMTSEERAKLEMEKSRKEFENERAQYVSEKAEFEAAKELSAQNLPVSFARMLADADKDKMLENISAFKAEYLKAIEAGLSQRLRGGLPKVSKERQTVTDPFLSGLGI